MSLLSASRGGRHSHVGRDEGSRVPVTLGEDCKPVREDDDDTKDEGRPRRVRWSQLCRVSTYESRSCRTEALYGQYLAF